MEERNDINWFPFSKDHSDNCWKPNVGEWVVSVGQSREARTSQEAIDVGMARMWWGRGEKRLLPTVFPRK